MIITDFKSEHIEAAVKLARENYDEERKFAPCLPLEPYIPDMTNFAENGLGVAAVDGSKLLGYICCLRPWDNWFDTEAKGTFVPLHAHAAVPESRAEIYKRMYQAAAEKWVNLGVTGHGIMLYEDDVAAVKAFFGYGFGQRCADAMRDMSPVVGASDMTECRVLDRSEVHKIDDLRRRLSEHLGSSPCFMYSTESEFQSWLVRVAKRNSRLFVTERSGKIIAFLEITDGGENFATKVQSVANICGAFCIEEYRHSGTFASLVNYAVTQLKSEGFTSLGVDYESFNPTASGFWTKHFKPYTCSVIRRIDEHILKNIKRG